ncbi:hypothetical protein NKG94_44010 [Micromonospora sp. M12]
MVKSPSEYDPADSDQKEATGRRNYVLDRMGQLGYLSPTRPPPPESEPIRLKLTTRRTTAPPWRRSTTAGASPATT